MTRRSASDINKIPGAGSYRPVYREDAVNRCPGCRATQWLVGRFSVECASCGTALPLQEGSIRHAYTHDEKPEFFTREGDTTERKGAA